jgi:nucleoid-associated protein EbfC
MKNFQQMIKQAEAMQAQLKQEMANIVVEASSGGGMVTVRMNGSKQIVGLKIEPEVINPQEADMLQDLIMAAINQAGVRIEEQMGEQVGNLAQMFKIPGLS